MRPLRLPAEPVLLALTASVFVLFAAGRAFDPALTYGAYFYQTHYHIGLRLVHGLPDGGVTYSMPVAPVLLVELSHLPRQLGELAFYGLELLPPLLSFALAWTVGGAACGLAALLLVVPVTPVWQLFSESALEGLVFSCALLLAAFFLSRDAEKPNRRTTLLAGLAVGFSMLVRSPLFLLPFLFFLLGFREKRRPWALLWVPALMLLPWVALNWRLFGRLILFEEGRANLNIVTGAMGMVHTVGASRQLAEELSGLAPGASTLGWAIRYVLTHPIDYLMAIPLRLWLIVQLHPLLVLGAVAGAWLKRRDPVVRTVAIVAAYYVAIHCLLAVEQRYFLPLWPLLAVLAAALVPGRRPADARPAAAAASAVLLPLSLFAAFSLWLAVTYPGRAEATGQDLEKVVRSHGRDPVLWHLYGQQRVDAGDRRGAAEAFGSALRLDPREEYRLAYLRAVTTCLDRRLFIAGSSPLTRSLPKGFWLVDRDLSDALQALNVQRRDMAQRSFSAFAATFTQGGACEPRRSGYEALREADLRRLLDKPALEWLRQRMAGWEPRDRDAVYRRLGALGLLPV